MSSTPSPSESSGGSGPVLQLLASGLQFWLRQHCDVEGHLDIQLQGSAFNLLRGRLDGVSLQARRVTYNDLKIELVDLRSGAMRVHLGNLLRGQPLQLDHAFDIHGQVSFCSEGLNRSFSSPRWRGLADWLAEQLLGITPLRELRVMGNRLVLTAQGVTPVNRVDLEVAIAAIPEGLAITSGDGQTRLLSVPLDPAIVLESARLEAGMVLLQGRARITP